MVNNDICSEDTIGSNEENERRNEVIEMSNESIRSKGSNPSIQEELINIFYPSYIILEEEVLFNTLIDLDITTLKSRQTRKGYVDGKIDRQNKGVSKVMSPLTNSNNSLNKEKTSNEMINKTKVNTLKFNFILGG